MINKLWKILPYALSVILVITAGFAYMIYKAPKVQAGYSYSRLITVDNTKVGAVNNTDQTNFTMLVCANGTAPCQASVPGLNQSGGGAHVTDAQGDDIIFTTDAACNSLMAWEKEKYVASTGELQMWVLIPSLSTSVDTVFYMCYGNSAITTFQGGTAANAWDSNYLGVWHIPDGSTISYTDSKGSNTPVDTGHALTATSTPIGGGVWEPFSKYASSTNPNFPTGTATKTLETIVKFTQATTTGFVVGGYAKSSQAGGAFEQYYNGSRMGINTAGSSIGFTKVLDTSWHYFAASATSSRAADVELYWDGARVSTTTVTGTTALNTGKLDLQIGRAGDYGTSFIGYIDEMRISNTRRNPDWYSTEYNNYSNPNNGASQFYSMGSESALAPPANGFKIICCLNLSNSQTNIIER